MTMNEKEPVALDVANLEYMGNSVGYIYQKMSAYKDGIDKIWQALRDSGIRPDGQTHAADAIRKALAHPAPAVAQEPVHADESMWCKYIATMISGYLREPVGSDKEKAIAGIIERRLWNLPKKEAPAVAVNEQLLEALKLADAALEGAHMNADVVYKKVKAAIAAAEAAKKGGV